MGYYDPYDQPDPEEERRKLEEMHNFAYGGDTPLPPELAPPVPADQPNDNVQPLRAALERVQPPGQLDAGVPVADQAAMPPEPDAERAAPILEGRGSQQPGLSPRELEDDAIRAVRDSYGKKRSFWEGAAPAAIAMGLDALLNKGRDTGAIVSGYAQGHTRAAQDDKDSMRAMAQLEIQRARESQRDQQFAQTNETNQGNLKARNAEIELARQRMLAEQGDPVAKRKLIESQTNLNEASAHEKWTGADKAITPYQQAMLDATSAERDSRDKDRDADREFRKTSHEDSAAATAAQRELIAAQKAESARELAKTRDTNATNTFLGKTEKDRSQLQAINSVQPILDNPKYAKDLPGVGVLDSNLPTWLMHPLDTQARDDATSMKQTLGEAEKYFQNKVTGVAGSKAEFADIAALKGLGGTEAEQRVALKRWRESLQADIRGAAAASPDNARNALDAQGLTGILPESVAPDPSKPQLPDDRSTPGPADLGTTQRLGPSSRGTGGFPGSAKPSNTYQGPTRPQNSPAIDAYRRKLQEADGDLGVGYR